jgi:hypothetical protein
VFSTCWPCWRSAYPWCAWFCSSSPETNQQEG